jgi:MFS family permease
MLVIGLTPSASGIIAGQAIAGVGAATLVPALVALIVANYKGKQQATAVGLLGASMGVGGSVGLLAEGYIINAFGWRVAFFTMAAIGLLTLVLPQSTRVLVNYSWKPK